jgi:hypothetical protein
VKGLLLGALAVVALAGCGGIAPSGPGAQPPAATVSGHVFSSPSCPVERVDNPCPPRPAAGVLLSFQALAGGVRYDIRTAADGGYSLQVPPGSYRVALGVARPLRSGPGQVTVGKGEVATADYEFDSGIR